jgi:hypothetical protein
VNGSPLAMNAGRLSGLGLQRLVSYQSSAQLTQLTRRVSVQWTYLSSFDDKYRFVVNHVHFAVLPELLILLYGMI